MIRLVTATLLLMLCATPASAQRRAFDLATPRPVNSIIATVDPEKIRFKQRQDAGKASINGQTLLPLETTIANGKKLVEIRASITVEAIKKALAAK